MRLELDIVRNSQRRAIQTTEQIALRQQTDAERRARARSNEWTEQRATHQPNARRSVSARGRRIDIDLHRSAFAYDHIIDYSSLPSTKKKYRHKTTVYSRAIF